MYCMLEVRLTEEQQFAVAKYKLCKLIDTFDFNVYYTHFGKLVDQLRDHFQNNDTQPFIQDICNYTSNTTQVPYNMSNIRSRILNCSPIHAPIIQFMIQFLS